MALDDTSNESVVVVTAGLVKLASLLPDGRKQIVALLYGSDSYWQTASSRNRFYAEAAIESDICFFSGRRFVDALDNHPMARQNLLERSLADLDHARSHFLVLGSMAAPERIAALLLELWKKSPRSVFQPSQPRSNLPTIVLMMTCDDMADYLGLTLETVSRCMTQFVLRGLIRRINARTIEICDPDLLSAIGRGNLETAEGLTPHSELLSPGSQTRCFRDRRVRICARGRDVSTGSGE